MTTTITRSFQAEEPIQHVWKHINDPEKLVNCLPGAALTETVDEDNYKGEVKLRFGPVKAKYNGVITFEERNPETKTLKMIGKGLDSKGKGSADMVMDCALFKQDGGTKVDYTIKISLTGMLSQFGARLITEVTNSVFDEFTDNFKETLKGEPIDNTVDTGKMAGKVTGSLLAAFIDWLKSLFGMKPKA